MTVSAGALAAVDARAATLVTLGFDDGTTGQLRAAATLDAVGLHATFYVNSARVGRPGRLTWPQLRALRRHGHEIAGHGRHHLDLVTLGPSRARAEICEDRDALTRHGLTVTTFAYPYGHLTPALERLVRACGYRDARALGGIAPSRVCPLPGRCPGAETLAPRDPLATRTAPPVTRRTGLAGLQAAVRRAEATGGWLQLVVHRVGGAGPSAVRGATLRAFARWLATRARRGTRVVTAAQAVAAPPPGRRTSRR